MGAVATVPSPRCRVVAGGPVHAVSGEHPHADATWTCGLWAIGAEHVRGKRQACDTRRGEQRTCSEPGEVWNRARSA